MAPPSLNRMLAAALGLLLASCGRGASDPEQLDTVQSDKAALGLFTTLPIYWGEEADIASMLEASSEPAWVRSALEERASLKPLDTLEANSLGDLDRVILAQPRPLAPSENVAFDNWLRAGGKALIFADPALTQESRFHLGDPRRPHDTVLLSPLLTRWGLELRFDEGQTESEREARYGDLALPVRLAGEFSARGEEPAAECAIADGGLVARCSVGEGEVLLVADAALLETDRESTERRVALEALTASIFDD